MPRKTLNQKLRRIDDRLAKIDRRLGFLQGRVFYREVGNSLYVEMPTLTFTDKGLSTTSEVLSVLFGINTPTRGLTVTVNRDWWDTNESKDLEYVVTFFEGESSINAMLTNRKCLDVDTFATLEFITKYPTTKAGEVGSLDVLATLIFPTETGYRINGVTGNTEPILGEETVTASLQEMQLPTNEHRTGVDEVDNYYNGTLISPVEKPPYLVTGAIADATIGGQVGRFEVLPLPAIPVAVERFLGVRIRGIFRVVGND